MTDHDKLPHALHQIQNIGAIAPPAAKIFAEKTVLKPLLGQARFLSGEGLLEGKPHKNSTRWVLDIEHNDATVELELLRNYASTPVPNIMTFFLAPLDRAFWGASVYVKELGPLQLQLVASQPCMYRLTVDTVHSLHR